MGAHLETNAFTIAGQTAILDVSTPKFPRAKAVIDRRDLDRVLDGNGRWFAAQRGHGVYVVRNLRRQQQGSQVLHSVIAGPPPRGKFTDHVDGDTMNNRRHNLRPATRPQNSWNQRPQKGRLSRFKGVSKRHGKWVGQIRRFGRLFHLGYFKVEKQAALAYDEAARRLFGKFARPNFV
jgi:hypothetical protein